MNNWIYLGLFFKFIESLEVCNTNDFQPRCAPDEIIRIKEASYGRKAVGKCIKQNFGYVGCLKDVTSSVQKACSGLHSCVQRVPPDSTWDEGHSCGELKNHLSVTYTCQKFYNPRRCFAISDAEIRLAPNRTVHVLSATTSETECGSEAFPWTVLAPPGMRIRVSLTDFRRPEARLRGSTCYIYGSISLGSRTTTLCSKGGMEQKLFQSEGGLVRIVVNPIGHVQSRFLLHLEASGCQLPANLPANSWHHIESDLLTVGCNASSTRWHLRCDNGVWGGDVIGVCPSSATPAGGGGTGGKRIRDDNYFSDGDVTSSLQSGELQAGFVRIGPVTLSVGVTIAVVVGLAVVISAMILCAGLLYIRGLNQSRSKRAAAAAQQRPVSAAFSPAMDKPAGAHQVSVPAVIWRENHYSHVDDEDFDKVVSARTMMSNYN